MIEMHHFILYNGEKINSLADGIATLAHNREETKFLHCTIEQVGLQVD